jgi:hypothetical protein
VGELVDYKVAQTRSATIFVGGNSGFAEGDVGIKRELEVEEQGTSCWYFFNEKCCRTREYLVFGKDDSYALILGHYVFFFILFCEGNLPSRALSKMLFKV